MNSKIYFQEVIIKRISANEKTVGCFRRGNPYSAAAGRGKNKSRVIGTEEEFE